jgi:hypothetical protein
LKCKVCDIDLDVAPWPCGVAPRYYVNEFGFIVACIDGCPHEEEKDPDYVLEECLPRMKAKDKAPIVKAAEELNNGDYQNLWASRYRQNYHLDFDCRERTAKWHRDHGSRVFNSHPRGSGRSQEAYWRAILRPDSGGLVVVPHYTQRLLQNVRNIRKGDYKPEPKRNV